MGGIVMASHLSRPKSPPNSDSLKPLYQWLSSPAVMWPRPSIWVATLSLKNIALLCQRVLLGLVEGFTMASFWAASPAGERNEIISPGEWPGHLKLRRL